MAAAIVAELAATAKAKSAVVRPFFTRGSDKVVRVEAQCHSKLVFKMRGSLASKAEVLDAIAAMSNRSLTTAAT